MSERQNGGHERWEGDAAAYALHALEDAEVRVFEEHLAACTRCQDELAALRMAVEALPAVAARAAPSSALKQRVMESVRTEARSAAAVKPVLKPPWARWPVSWRQWPTPHVAGLAAAAVAAVVVLILVTAGGGGSARTYAGVVHARGASASVRQAGNTVQLRFVKLPAPPPGRIYQVWLQRGGALHPTRTLFATGNGSVAVHGSLRGVQAVLVTAEPRPNGSRAPTRAPIIAVRIV